jgi:hypothetical protein
MGPDQFHEEIAQRFPDHGEIVGGGKVYVYRNVGETEYTLSVNSTTQSSTKYDGLPPYVDTRFYPLLLAELRQRGLSLKKLDILLGRASDGFPNEFWWQFEGV